MLSLNEVKIGKLVQIANEPFVVIKADHHKMGRGGAVLKLKMRNLINGAVLEKTMQGNDKMEPADTEKRKANYLYKDDTNAYFMDNDSFEQFELPVEQLGSKLKFMKDNTDVDTLYFQGKPVSIDLPIKMDLKVISAPPGVKGNSAGNVSKTVTIETGAEISVPMFVEEGDVIRINTDTEEYSERVNK
jgi:elongation factor P